RSRPAASSPFTAASYCAGVIEVDPKDIPTAIAVSSLERSGRRRLLGRRPRAAASYRWRELASIALVAAPTPRGAARAPTSQPRQDPQPLPRLVSRPFCSDEEASMVRAAGLVVAALLFFGVLLGGCLSLLGGGSSTTADQTRAANGASGGGPAVPPDWESLDQQAATRCPGLPWSVLAAIGRVESDSGRSSAPGVASGANAAGAEGPMQFEPATFATYATIGPGGADPASPYDMIDAVYSAATLLCADGGATAATLTGAIRAYNHSTTYVDTVLVLARALADDPGLDAVPARRAALQRRAARHALSLGRDRRRRLRLLGPRPGRLRRGRRAPPARRAGPVR